MTKKLAVLINPLAGLGGRAGLKGSDGEDIQEQALALGGKAEASARAEQALSLLTEMEELPQIFTYGGDMGENQLRRLGLPAQSLGVPAAPRSTRLDTQEAARRFLEEGCDLLLFAGGDGTARDICSVIQNQLPVVGIPAGVKIHSGVYAINPRNAGRVAVDYLEGRICRTAPAAVMDIDEDAFRLGRVQAKQYGEMQIPLEENRMQCSKSSCRASEDELLSMAQYAADLMEDETLYIIGPGSTTQAIMDELGLENTLLGIDAVKNSQLLASDLNEQGLLQLLDQETGAVKLILTIIGGQGNLFGRGNQQLSPSVLRRIGKENMIIVSTPSKLHQLGLRPLLVDTGDPELDQALCGYAEILVAYEQFSMHKISC
ncbi:MAG: ATP-NAD kinase family protein [Firmicutes bacterium]|nr:ATP-NAD kinase family protein [Bacillota bacterium]